MTAHYGHASTEELAEGLRELGEAISRMEDLGEKVLRAAQEERDLKARISVLEADLRWVNEALRSLRDADAERGGGGHA